jgi:hypothetical protein
MAALLVEDDPEPSAATVPPVQRRIAAEDEARNDAANAVPPGPASLHADADRDAVADQTIQDGIDPFRSKSWFITPPPPPPPRPTAPPLPFQYLGQIIEHEGTRIFLNHQGRHLVIKAGDIIGGVYAVEEILAGKVIFIYLPLKERQVMATSAG